MNTVRSFDILSVSLLYKIHYKLGGVAAHLASQRPINEEKAKQHHPIIDENNYKYTYQKVPQSLPWMFDQPTIVMGVSINHSKHRNESPIVGVVASMDSYLGQYGAYMAVQIGNLTTILVNATVALLDAFSLRNNWLCPRRIIIYRNDDVMHGNSVDELKHFNEILRIDVEAVQKALYERRGFPAHYVQVSLIVCQRNHTARLMSVKEEESFHSERRKLYCNPPVGLCIDGRHFVESCDGTLSTLAELKNDLREKTPSFGCINTPHRIEFYLNSHFTSHGTAAPTKYMLIYDEIGWKLTELELFTYWTTFLSCRCTKSIAIATPANYAKLAGERGRILMRGGATAEELEEISRAWLEQRNCSMYFA